MVTAEAKEMGKRRLFPDDDDLRPKMLHFRAEASDDENSRSSVGTTPVEQCEWSTASLARLTSTPMEDSGTTKPSSPVMRGRRLEMCPDPPRPSAKELVTPSDEPSFPGDFTQKKARRSSAMKMEALNTGEKEKRKALKELNKQLKNRGRELNRRLSDVSRRVMDE